MIKAITRGSHDEEVMTVAMDGDIFALGAEAATILFNLQKKARQELGRENGDQFMRDITSVIRPGSDIRKAVKKSLDGRNKG